MKTLYLVGPAPSYRGQKVLEQACRDAGVSDYKVVPNVMHVESDLMVCLGTDALQIMVPDAPDAIEARGYFWDVAEFGAEADRGGPDYRVLASMHPDDCDKQWVPYRKLLEIDLRKAKAELDAGCPAFPKREVIIVTNRDELLQLYQEFDNVGKIALDIENDRDLKLSCLGVGITPNLAYVIPAGTRWQIEAIKDVCENDLPKVLQNGQYDKTFLQWFNGIVINNFTFDTMLAWHSYMPELAGAKEDSATRKKAFRKTEKSLRFLASIFCRTTWWKNYGFSDEMEKYTLCGLDNCLTLEIAGELERLIA